MTMVRSSPSEDRRDGDGKSGAAVSLPRILIIGGGFGGLAVARALGGRTCEVLLLDRRNHHLFQPLLYQVATAGLSGSDIAQPIRRLVRKQKNVEVHMAEVESIDLHAKTLRVHGRVEPFGFDLLVIACGVETNWFGHPEYERFAIGLKTLTDAYTVRDRVLLALERAENTTPDETELRARLLTMVVVGGGPTGVEMAGALAELTRRTAHKELRHVSPEACRVILVDGGERVLSAFDPASSARALADLQAMGVEVRLKTIVDGFGEGWVSVGGEKIAAETVVWAAGVRAPDFMRTLGVPADRAGRVIVAPDCRVPGHPEVYVIGDAAALKDGRGVTVPGVAQGAMQAGAFVGRSIAARLADGSVHESKAKPFVFRDKGTMATIGRRRAVVELGKLKFGGALAWLLWLFIHLLFLIDVRSKITVLLKWAWAYMRYDPTNRILAEVKAPDAAR